LVDYKQIFPGANVPAVSHIVASIQKGSSGNLILDKLENIGGHYVKALKTWRENFQRNFEKLIQPELLRRNRDVDVEVFARKWEVS
jgi:cyclopropane-fatty-acyl-phospholipid synthase